MSERCSCRKCFDLRCAEAEIERLEEVAAAARAIYEEDDVFTVRTDGDGRVERDNRLGDALRALDSGGERGFAAEIDPDVARMPCNAASKVRP